MFAAIAIWVGLMLRLMIADVWDETNGMLYFSDAAIALGTKVHFALTQSLGFYRPLPTLVATLFLHFIPSFDWSWRVIRVFNMALLIGALFFLLDAAEQWSPKSDRRRLLFTIAFLFSGSAIMVANWYANIFDASSLFLIALGLSQLARGRDVAAGVIMGIGFFAKETTILALPFLVILWAAGRVSLRSIVRTATPAVILGGAYFYIRSRIIPFGQATDTHGFVGAHFLPTLINFSSTFWVQMMKRPMLVVGFVILAFSLAALRKPGLIALMALFFVGCAIIYWGMLIDYEDGALIHYHHFVGRLYLIPVALFLLLLTIEGRNAAICVLLIPIVFGAAITYRDHARFQRTYRRIYRTAAQATVKPLRVHFPMKPLADKVRGVEIGDYPTAPVVLDGKTGRLTYR